MRDAFANEITVQAKNNKDIVLLSGDIGNRMFDSFKEVAPDRFFNCGIAEANMMSVASGMALSGLRPFVYTITPFTTARCLEQIRIGGGYHNTNITIVGTGSGLSYSELGPTHHSLDDIAMINPIEINNAKFSVGFIKLHTTKLSKIASCIKTIHPLLWPSFFVKSGI